MLNIINAQYIYLPSIANIGDWSFLYRTAEIGVLLIFAFYLAPSILHKSFYNTKNSIISSLILSLILVYLLYINSGSLGWFFMAMINDSRNLLSVIILLGVYLLVDNLQAKYFRERFQISPELAMSVRDILCICIFILLYIFFIITWWVTISSLSSVVFWTRIWVLAPIFLFLYYIRNKYFYLKPIMWALVSLWIVVIWLFLGYFMFAFYA